MTRVLAAMLLKTITFNKVKLKYIGSFLFVCILLNISTLSYAISKAEEATLTKQQLEKVTKDISKLHDELGKDKSFQKKEQSNLKKVEVELGSLRNKSRTLQQKKQTIQSKISNLREQEQVLIEKNNQQQKALNKDLQAIYKLGKQEKLKLLLNQESPEDLARTLKYYDYYTEARVERILSYQRNIKSIEEKRKEIEQELSALQTLQEEIDKEARKLQTQQDKRQTVLSEINKTIRTKDQQLKTLLNNQTRLSKLLRSLQGIWADIPSKVTKTALKKQKGKLQYPVTGDIKHSFGSQRAGGRMKWNGWLIDAPLNTNVEAIHDGRVVFSDWIRGYGLLIIIDHSDGYLSLYGHNASVLKEAGDWVHKGDILATVGDSGGQNETGLYFELRHEGRPLNPKSWLTK
jgi:septal ring factor EnvC (AmiA/AmiB activator)